MSQSSHQISSSSATRRSTSRGRHLGLGGYRGSGEPFYCNAAVDEFGLLDSLSYMNMALPVLPEEYRLRRVNMVLPDDLTEKLLLSYETPWSKSFGTHVLEHDLPSERWSNLRTP